ncbi:MAG: glycosyltransferase family 1 protein [Porticoccaceae bacterium]|nr:glycosyltransferase family 1 protein [Porticoccaceae bacterium]
MNFKHQQSLSLLVDVSSLRAPLTGVGRYVLEILTQLPEQVELRGFNDYRCYEPPALNGFLRSFDEPESDSVCHQPPSQSRLRPLAKQALKRVPGSRQLRTRLLDKRIRDCLALNGESVYWQPNFILGKSKAPSIVTAYDLSHVRFPDFHPSERLIWLQRELAQSLDRSDHIMTVSAFSKAEIMNVYGVPAEKISVVYPGVSNDFHQTYSVDKLAVLKKKYGLPAQYLLSLGTFEPRKNLKNLVRAYARLPPCLRKCYPLVLAGGQGWKHRETDRLIRQLQSRGELIRLGYVDQWDLPLLYQSASAFAYVSFYEGFGMPVAEAMASGTPVITSVNSSMEEVALGCAQLVEADEVDSITAGLSYVLENASSLHARCDKARKLSTKYSWVLSAEKLVNIVRKINVK